MEGQILAQHHCPVVSHDVRQLLCKLLSKQVRNKTIRVFSSSFDVKIASSSDETAASTLISSVAARLLLASFISSSSSSGAFTVCLQRLISAFMTTERKLIGKGKPDRLKTLSVKA